VVTKGARSRAASRSDAQKEAEDEVRSQLGAQLQVSLSSKDLDLGEGTRVALDGHFAAVGKVIAVEISAQVGKPKAGQQKKILADILKLALVRIVLESQGQSVRSILAFIDEKPTKWLSGDGWGALAVRTFKIEVKVVVVDPQLITKVKSAKVEQNLHKPED